MEQPWPPPGPWSFPRTGGETEEESDLDVSPSSSHYSPVPDGGAQSFINQDKRKTEDEDKSQSFMQKYEQKIRHFGMLSRWDDSQRFLSDHPYLVCEETAKYLILWCFHLEAEQKGALMEQIAHQAVVMQFIMEMAKNCNVDPRGCFRLFFQKAKAEEEGYFEAFKNELEAFKARVRLYAQSQSFAPVTVENHAPHSGVGCIGSAEPLPQGFV
ncbi:hsp90 co-chaperone Cdc37-like 1 isoform X5 [Rattus norvegicus]|uniref:hsp90 co-chaperone Cdc37-like 1 isoform X5 n=1 Tax=Rattus norvegicus TaxID=10116 RepID=UPI0019170AD1|nr:hsp90 co-chaperone Cdc37-like 1 isoform X4 [Rattus norvegicus]